MRKKRRKKNKKVAKTHTFKASNMRFWLQNKKQIFTLQMKLINPQTKWGKLNENVLEIQIAIKICQVASQI